MDALTLRAYSDEIALARKARERMDAVALTKAADALLAKAPDEPLVLVLKGDAFRLNGDSRSAVTFYGAALARAQGLNSFSNDLRAELAHASRMQAKAAQRYEQIMRDGMAQRGMDPADPADARIAASLDLMTGRRRLYYQQPKFYLFPGLPQIEFQPRETVAWLNGIEAATPAIRAELDAILAQPELFAPYVEDRQNRPKNEQAGMLGNADWSAVFLWKDGEEVPEITSRCPETMKALAHAPLCRIPGRSPSILFSKLKAGAHIPPHTGLINTRLICHLPLVVPPDCRFRVGNEVREWKAGEAWAFDDTIEHEAKNASQQDRTILIFDVWKPEITAHEQQRIVELFATIDEAGGGGTKLGV